MCWRNCEMNSQKNCSRNFQRNYRTIFQRQCLRESIMEFSKKLPFKVFFFEELPKDCWTRFQWIFQRISKITDRSEKFSKELLMKFLKKVLKQVSEKLPNTFSMKALSTELIWITEGFYEKVLYIPSSKNLK